MSITFHNIKKWYRMLSGQSILHVNQNIGQAFSVTEIKGYYNDLTEKVTRQPELLQTTQLPQMQTPEGNYITFSVGIFQYGLGAYDLYLMTKNPVYYQKFWQTIEWTLEHQDDNGAWDTFSWTSPMAPYGAMAQGEAVSLLIRAYKETSDDKYLKAASNAVSFLLKPIEDGGCTLYQGGDVFLLEYTNKPAVLNGWIFAWWGLYDYVFLTNDIDVKQKCDASLRTLVNSIRHFSKSYWSLYDISNIIASPFYHNLHIAQMQAMFKLTGIQLFKDYELLWRGYQKQTWCKTKAFVYKSWQKIIE